MLMKIKGTPMSTEQREKNTSKKLYFDESVWEDYVAKNPEAFLNENLKLFKRQWPLPSGTGRPDLVFERENGELLVVELQLRALDRNHFYKTFEYQSEIEAITSKTTKIIILCNTLNRRKDFLQMHRQNLGIEIDVIVMPKKEVQKRIKEIDPCVVFVSSKSKSNGFSKRATKQQATLQESYYKNKIEKLEETLLAEKKSHLPTKILLLVQQKEKYKNIWRWEEALFQIVETMAKPHQHKTWYGHEERALCPLCNRGANDIYEGEIGWKMPLGLERHILHSHGALPCKISGNALELVKPYFFEKFDKELKNREEELNQRRIVENTFLTNPNESPKLIDEKLAGYRATHRSTEQLKTAEKTLSKLNFSKTLVNGVVKYTHQIGDHIVFADPRIEGRIDFLLFKQRTLKKGISYKLVGKPRRDFFILDKWKDTEAAFNKRMTKLLKPK